MKKLWKKIGPAALALILILTPSVSAFAGPATISGQSKYHSALAGADVVSVQADIRSAASGVKALSEKALLYNEETQGGSVLREAGDVNSFAKIATAETTAWDKIADPNPAWAKIATAENPAWAKVAETTPSDESGSTDGTENASEEPASDGSSTDGTRTDDTYNHVWPKSPKLESESVFVIENSTDAVMIEKDADTKRYPASTTKILTALLAIENCDMNEIVKFSEKAVTLEEAASNIKAQAGEKMPMRDVLYGLMLASGNECANAIAEHVAGSVKKFAKMMNQRAQEIGCTGSHFSNPHGLYADDHYTTARDMALIAQEAYNNSTFLDIISTKSYTAAPTNKDDAPKIFNNTNLLIDEESDYYQPDVIGGKTGYLDEAGRCLVTYAKHDGFTVISVQFKGPYEGIFAEAKKLLNYTFKNFSLKNVAENERRFSDAVEGAKVSLDPSARIMTLNSIPFDQLESELIFVDDMSVERKADAQISAAMEPGRTLYAAIDYRYAGHDLGSVNVYLNSKLDLLPAAFTPVYYVSPIYLVIFVAIILILIFSFYGTRKSKRQQVRRGPARASAGAPRTRRR